MQAWRRSFRAIMPMPFRAVLFDLDGTLLDTLADIAHSANRVLGAHGCAEQPIDAYRYWIGDGVTMLFRRVLPAERRDEETIARCVADFREVYAGNWNVETRRYDGVAEMLDAVAARGLLTAVLSNKPDAFTQRCVDEYLAQWHFDAVLGQRDDVPPKPDPAGAMEIVKRLGVPAETFIYLGDTATDMQTARRAGMYPVGAAWGFRSVEELLEAGAAAILHHPINLAGLLDRTPSS